MKNQLRACPGALALGLLLSAPLFAQTPVMPTVSVTAVADEDGRGPVDGYAAKRSASATKTDTPIKEIPQSITVIPAQQIKDQNAQTMQEVLRYAAGVSSEMYGLDNRGDWFSLRGGSEGSTLLDGLRLPLNGYWGSLRNEPYAFERVEVLRGPSSVIAGQNGPGGVVNLVSKRPQAVAAREVSVQYGSDNHKQVALDMTGAVNADGSLLYRLVALGRDSGTQVDHADEERQYFAPSITWRDARTSITGYYEYQRDESGNLNAFLPWVGSLYTRPGGRVSDSFFVGEPDWDSYGGHRNRVGYEVAHEFNDTWSVRHDLRYEKLKGHVKTMYGDFFGGLFGTTGDTIRPNGDMDRLWYAGKTDSNTTNTDLQVEGKLNWGAAQHTVLLGMDAMWQMDDTRSAVDEYANPINVYNPVYGLFPEPHPEYFGDPIHNRRIGVFAQDQIKIDRLVLVGSLRRDFARTGTDATETEKNNEWTTRLGAVYLADGGWSPYVSYSESFEPITGTTRQGDLFEPLRGKQWEVGTRWQPLGDKLTFSTALYRLIEENRQSPDPVDVNFSVQKGEVEVKGVEFEVVASFTAWDIIGYYTHTIAEDEDTGEQLSGIAKNAAALWVVHKFSIGDTPGFRVGLGARYVGESEDGSGGHEVDSYTLFDGMLAFRQKEWEYALNASNLLDEQYLATCLDRGDCWYGSRRKVMGTITYHF